MQETDLITTPLRPGRGVLDTLNSSRPLSILSIRDAGGESATRTNGFDGFTRPLLWCSIFFMAGNLRKTE